MKRLGLAVMAAIAALEISAAVALAAQQPSSAARSQVTQDSGNRGQQPAAQTEAQPAPTAPQTQDVDEQGGTNDQSEIAGTQEGPDEQDGPNNQTTVDQNQQEETDQQGDTNQSQNSGQGGD